MRRLLWTIGVVGLVLAAAGCGGAAQSTAPTPALTPVATAAAPVSDKPSAASSGAPAASLSAGSIKYRVINLSTASVDVYVRSQGVVKAAPAALAVGSGTVSTTFAPPEPGTVVVLRAGGTNPTCVSGCGFLAEASTNAGEGGQRTIVVRADGATEYWETPKPGSVGTIGNAIRPVDAARPLLMVIGQAVTDAQFGLNLAYAGTAGCQKNAEASNLLIGGTSVIAFAPPAAGVDVNIHRSTDKDCAGTPAGGPFRVGIAAGARAYLFLSGTTGSMKGLVVPIP